MTGSSYTFGIKKMKKHLGNRIFIALLLPLLCSTMGYSQTIAIENIKQNVANPGLENPLNIVVEGIPCDQVAVVTNNGTMKYEGDCHYVFIPHRVGEASIVIFKINGKDTVQLAEQKYWIKSWPVPEAVIGDKKSGTMGLGQFKAQNGIIAPIGIFDINGTFAVQSFRMQIVRNGEVVASVLNDGSRFEEKARAQMDKIQVNDQVIFDQIKVRMPGQDGAITVNTIVIDIN
jgi:hypothetical protein